MKKNKNQIIPNKEDAKFYTLDPSKSVVAEGYKSSFPLVFLLVAVFFCCIYIFIVITGGVDKNEPSSRIILIVCCVLLGIALAIFCGYHIRNFLVKKRIRAALITAATVTSAIISRRTTRDGDGKTHTHEHLSLTYVFYDKDGNLHTENFMRNYQSAPYFYEGQQLIVAFDEQKCYVLSKYSLLDDDGNVAENIQNEQDEKIFSQLTGEAVNIDPQEYVPLGYDKRYYICSGVFSVFAIGSTALTVYSALTVNREAALYFAAGLGLFAIIFWALTLYYFVIPIQAKRKYDRLTNFELTYTNGRLISTNALYGNDVKGKCACVYIDGNGKRQRFGVRAEVSKRRIRQGHTDVVVAYADNKAIALIRSEETRIILR